MQVELTEVPYEITDPTVYSQVISLKVSGADIIFLAATPKTAGIKLYAKMAAVGLEADPAACEYIEFDRRGYETSRP